MTTDDGRQRPTHDPWRVPSLDEPGQLGRLVIDDVRIDQYRRLEAILRSAARFRRPSQAKSARRPIIDALLAQACVLSQTSPKARDILITYGNALRADLRDPTREEIDALLSAVAEAMREDSQESDEVKHGR